MTLLALRPKHGRRFRWLPRHGAPLSLGEWLSQQLITLLARAPIYAALLVALIVAIQIFHPLGLGA